MAELSKSDRGDEVDGVKLSDLFYGRHFRVVFTGPTLLALQQLSGINAVFYFSSTVFKSAGVPSDIANMSVGVMNLSGSVVAMILMDKLGRKGLLLGSFMGMALSMAMRAAAGSSVVSEFLVMYLSVGGVLLFVLSFAMGLGPVPGLLLSEIFPGRITAKAMAMAICMAVHWVFKNHGASAGASMSHSHSQILALPVVPTTTSTRLDSMKEYHNQTGNCILCNIRTDKFLIDESAHFISIAPFASTFPFETWIVPHYHSSHYHELDEDKAVDLGGLLKLTLQKLSIQLNDPPYNFMIHTSPLDITSSQLPYTHWYIQIVPQLSTVGGFEMGTGCYINPVFPEDVATILKELELPNKK